MGGVEGWMRLDVSYRRSLIAAVYRMKAEPALALGRQAAQRLF